MCSYLRDTTLGWLTKLLGWLVLSIVWDTEALGWRGLSLFETPYRVAEASDGGAASSDDELALAYGMAQVARRVVADS